MLLWPVMPVVGQREAGKGWRKGLVVFPVCRREALLQPHTLIFLCNSTETGMVVYD